MFKSKIADFRDEIDQIDEKILCLLSDRFEVSYNIGQAKKENGVDLLDRSREKEMIEERVNNNCSQKLPKELIETIFISILQHCRKNTESRLDIKQISDV